MPWSRSASPARPGCRSAGKSSGKSAIVSEDRWAVCVCVCVCVCLRLCTGNLNLNDLPLFKVFEVPLYCCELFCTFCTFLFSAFMTSCCSDHQLRTSWISTLTRCSYCSSCIMRHLSPLCSDSMLLLVEGVDVLPSPPRRGAGCHVVAVVSSFQGASWRPVLRHRDTHQRLSHGNGLSSTFRLF